MKENETTHLGSCTPQDPLRPVVDEALCDAILRGHWTTTDLYALARWARARLGQDLHELSMFEQYGTGWVETKEAAQRRVGYDLERRGTCICGCEDRPGRWCSICGQQPREIKEDDR